jgi:asparagine N-glycosylation enzyme membrane subunit Stt3
MIEVGETVADLQSEIRRRRSALDRLSGDDSGYEAALAELVKSTDALLEYEDQIPAILGEPQRRVSERIVKRVAWAVLAGLGVVSVAIAWPGGPSVWWLLLLLPLVLLCLVVLRFVEVARQHLRQRYGAWFLGATAAFAVVVVTGLVPAWAGLGVALGAVVSLWFLGFLDQLAKDSE